MPYDLLMPQLGMTMTEGSVVKWLKEPGDAVEKGELLYLVQTDKVEVEIESPCSGTLAQVLVDLGQVVLVGTVIGRVTQPGDSLEPVPRVPMNAPTPAQDSPIPSSPPSNTDVSASPNSNRPRLPSQRAKKLARELGVDVHLVPDYDGSGRIVEADVQRFYEERSSVGPKPVLAPAVVSSGVGKNETSSAARKTITARMTASAQTIPHFYLTVLSDATELGNFRDRLANEIEKQVGIRLSYTDILLKALAIALRKHPAVNAYWQNGAVQRDRINVGFAVQTPDRVIVPVVRDADKLPLAELTTVRGTLLARASACELKVDDVGDASCTLSNLGSHGVDYFHAIINPPESCIVAAGRIGLRPMVVNGVVLPRQTVYLSLSADHRLIDGTSGAEFLNTLVGVIESPDTLLHS